MELRKILFVLFVGILLFCFVSAESYSSARTVSRTLSDSSFANGFTGNLKMGDSLKFNLVNQTYILTVNSISNESIILSVDSVSQIFVMKVGENVNIDVNNDSVYDANVSYLKYYYSFVSLKIKAVSIPYEPVYENELLNETPYGIGEQISQTDEFDWDSFFDRLYILFSVVVIIIFLRIFIKSYFVKDNIKR